MSKFIVILRYEGAADDRFDSQTNEESQHTKVSCVVSVAAVVFAGKSHGVIADKRA